MRKKARTFSGHISPEVTDRERKNREIARYAASEGIAMLKNENILPLSVSEPIAVFGAGAGKTVKGGTGSGDVNERESVNIFQGLKDAGFIITSESWIEDYDIRYQEAREKWKQMILKEAGGLHTPDFFKVYSSHTFHLPEGKKIEQEELQDVKKAIYVISRIAGEASDRFEKKVIIICQIMKKKIYRRYLRSVKILL